ncbi:MAG: hypothetical protein IKV00_09385, partial [Clostridia bacterium]|nr:hypothetical protein [Clostridia bacterium]
TEGACGTNEKRSPYQGTKGFVARAPSVAFRASSLPEGALQSDCEHADKSKFEDKLVFVGLMYPL